MAHEALTALKPVLAALPAETVIEPTMPVGIYLGECEQLAQTSFKDAEALEKEGLETGLIAGFPQRIDALRSSEVLCEADMKSPSNAEARWKNESVTATALRSDLLKRYRIVFKKNPSLSRTLVDISEHDTFDEMLLDLARLAELGEANRPALAAARFDFAKLDTARRLATELPAIFGAKRAQAYIDSPALLLRDQAFTYAKLAVDAIRDYGKLLYKGKSPRAALYRSEYLRKKKDAQSKKAAGKGPVTAPEVYGDDQ